jgi:ATP-binding cassette subfamily B protein
VRAGALTLGDLLLVVGYLGQLLGPLREVGTKVADLQRAMAGAERTFALLDEKPEAEDRPGAKPLARARGEIDFRSVSFGFAPGTPLLEEVTFHVPAGSRVGIAGRTGSGKTTLLSLLFRFNDPTAGEILLDGTDLRDIRLKDLRAQFALVLQDSVLFSTTIAENIAYARPEATPDEIVAAARAANAHDFVTALPSGYDTEVGERGMRLSGGERQRIALARAFLKDAPILILDEPTSALDVATERAVVEALDRLAEGRATFTIAHRPGTLASCDVRLEVRDGRVHVLGDRLPTAGLDPTTE